MNLQQSEAVLKDAIELAATAPQGPFHPASALKGRTFVQIKTAACLQVAKIRQLGSFSDEFKKSGDEFVQRLGVMIPFGLCSKVVPTAEAERLSRISRSSPDFPLAVSAAIRARTENEAFKADWDACLKVESIAPFYAFCWSLQADDPLYWQKVYTKLGLAYDDTCPKGMLEPNLTPAGRLDWGIERAPKFKEANPTIWVLLVILGGFLLWLALR